MGRIIEALDRYKIEETAKEIRVNRFPKIGWWLDNDPVTFYHGTHKDNLESVLKNGLTPSKIGYTAGFVSLALEPNTAHGYAVMSSGGEQEFMRSRKKAAHVPDKDRVTFVMEIPQSYFLKKMAAERGKTASTKGKLLDKEEYERLSKHQADSEFYALTEIRLPAVPIKFIKGYTFLRGK